MPDSRGNTVRQFKPCLPSTRVVEALRRFYAGVDYTSGCWIWTRAENGNGYGVFWSGERLVLAHRFAYEAFVGEIPPGLEIDHRCRNRGCVNPAHLEPVTHRLNQLRGRTFTAANAAKTHCPTCGSDYARTPQGSRYCKPCNAQRNREWRARQRIAA